MKNNTNSNTEHSKKLRAKTANESKKKAIENGGLMVSALIKDREMAEFARKEIPNKTQFVIEAVKRFMAEKKTA